MVVLPHYKAASYGSQVKRSISRGHSHVSIWPLRVKEESSAHETTRVEMTLDCLIKSHRVPSAETNNQ